MKPTTVSLREDQYELLEEKSGDGGDYDSKSEFVRELIDGSQEVESLRQENERLQRQLRETNKRVDEHQELVDYVEQEQSLQQRREERRDAPAWRRAKWWLLGRD